MADSVSPEIRFSAAGDRLAAPVITRLMAAALDSPGLLSLAAGFTDTTMLPMELVGRAVEEIRRRSGPPEVLQYGTNQGRPLLRELLANRLAEQDGQSQGTYETNRLFIANGSQQALALATQVLCDPGDIVLVERPTYFVYLDVLRGLGVEPRMLPADEHGRYNRAELEAWFQNLAREGKLERVKALYWQGYYGNPSGRSLHREDKAAVAEVLLDQGLRIPVIEDAAYRELYFGQPDPTPSVLALEEFVPFPRLYLGTLTKAFATGLKVGWGYCTSRPWLDRILFLKGQHDFGTANFCQAILEQVVATGQLDSYLAELRAHYGRKMEVLHSTLEEAGLSAAGWRWDKPAGGLYLWLEGPAAANTRIDSAFCHECLQKGVLYVPGDLCFGGGVDHHFARLSFGVLGEEDLREAGRRFTEAAARLTPN